ncbi:hypothetical protein BC826DRAFT_1058100 [Russula brevipes]|nr:hypothetical protein BC826DRAFT_1058100 [Russula brevipes]
MIHILPDEVLLEIFCHSVGDEKSPHAVKELDEWHALVHVCQRWRKIVLTSPRRLKLRLLCTERRPVTAETSLFFHQIRV